MGQALCQALYSGFGGIVRCITPTEGMGKNDVRFG